MILYRNFCAAALLFAYLAAGSNTNLWAQTFIETFDEDPNTPSIFSPAWNVALFTRDRNTWVNVDPGNIADHGIDCSPPPAFHAVELLEESVYTCKNHLMTAINDDGFGVVTLTPNHMLDLSSDKATVSFDLSTARSGGYDWIEIMLTPYEDKVVTVTPGTGIT